MRVDHAAGTIRQSRLESCEPCPCDTRLELAQVTLFKPGGLWLDSLQSELFACLHDQLLLRCDTCSNIDWSIDSVGTAEHLNPMSAIGSLGIPEPLDALLVTSKRDRVFQSVGHVEDRGCRSRMVPVDESNDVPPVLHGVPRPEIPMADQLPGGTGPYATRPSGLRRRVVPRDSIVELSQEACPAPQPPLRHDLCPSFSTGLPLDPCQHLMVTDDIDYAWGGKIN
jgi:hypothetical protein